MPQAEFIGLSVPDPNLRWNEETKLYEHSDIDWAEFKAVVAGHGRMNRDRIRDRNTAHVAGAWVREAALAHAAKRADRHALAREAAE